MVTPVEVESIIMPWFVFIILTIINGVISALLLRISKKLGGLFFGIFELIIIVATL